MNKYFYIDNDTILCEKIDGETVVINLTNGNYFNLNQTASYIWELAGSGLARQAIIDAYSNAYSKNTGKPDEEVSAILDSFVDNGLAALRDEAVTGNGIKADAPEYTVPAVEKFDDMQEMLLLDPIHEVTEKGWPYKSDE